MSENKMKNEFRQSFFIFDVKNVFNSKNVTFFLNNQVYGFGFDYEGAK